MVVRPLALVIVAAFVIVAAGTGAYVAVIQNDAATVLDMASANPEFAAVVSPASSLDLDPAIVAVESTEEIVEPLDEASAEATADTATPPVAKVGREKTATARSKPAARGSAESVSDPRAEPVPKDVAAPASLERSAPSSRRDLPDVEGWTRLERPWPSRDTSHEPERVALEAVDAASLGIGLAPEERPPVIEELVISADSVIGLQVDTPVSSDHARVEDDVEARVIRDVIVRDRIAVSAGTRVMGSVVLVKNAGKLKGVSRLGVRFHTLVMDDGAEVPLVTETVYREGKSKGGKSAGKIGGAAIGGAILGAIFGGRQGAAIGGAVGAAGGTAVAMAGDAQPATLPAGATVTVRLSRPATVTVER